MSFTETLEALGSWDLELAEETPADTLAQLGYYGHLVVIDGQVDVDATGNGLLASARYVGVCRARAKPGTYTRSGSGLRYWLGDEDDKGHVIEAEISLSNATLAQVVTALLPPTVTVGTVFPQANPATRYTGKHVFQSRRKALSIALAPFGAELRVNGNFTVDVGTPAQLYDTALPLTSKPSPMIVRKGAGSDPDLTAVGGEVETEGAVYDLSTRVVLLGQTVGVGDEPDTVFVTGAADAPSVPWNDPQGNPVKSTRLISESSETTGSVAARAQLQLNRFNRETTAIRVTADDFEISGGFGVGDATYVYDPDSGILDTANQVAFRAEMIHPTVIRVTSLTSPIVEGMTVAWRTDSGVWLDLTRWVVWESAGSREITVGDLPKSLSRPSDPIQDRVDAARGNPSTKTPKAPTGLTLATSSAVNPKGTDAAVITASWSAVTQYTDDTTVALSHYEVQYRATFRAPQWQASSVTASTTVDLAVVAALGYDVQVRAWSTGGVPSAWTSAASITSAADSTGPATPSDPLVTQYLGLLRIYWNGLSSAGGAMPADFNRVDVHVGTTAGFTASAATLVSSLSAAGYAHTTAPYGSPRYVRFIAYDHNGNPSSSSATVAGSTVQAGDGDVAALSVGKLTAGIITADVQIAGRFTTALTGARREVNAIGFQAFDAAENLTINFDGVNNLLTGRFRTALTGRRIEMGAAGSTGAIQFLAPDGTETRIRAFTSTLGDVGAEAIQMGVKPPLSTIWQGWGSVAVEDDAQFFAIAAVASIIVGGNGPETHKGFRLDWASDRGTATVGPTRELRYHVVAQETWQYASTHYFQPLNSQGGIVAHGWGRIAQGEKLGTPSAGWGDSTALVLSTPQMPNGSHYGGMLKYAINNDLTNGGLEARHSTDGGFTALKASAFNVNSSQIGKEAIQTVGSALTKVRGARAVSFRRKSRPGKDRVLTEDGLELQVATPPSELEVGVIAEEMPVEMLVPGIRPEDGPAVSLSAGLALALASISELADGLDELRDQMKGPKQ